ncbi:GTP pyrophosphokinase [Bacteroides stercorirosoris]|jgi:ppGpp synthetase/RelA/SpoT-type nucleotidyltranferase|uniref:PpGpp synthetase catalytic domain-containing protein (RelA/SpoT-type nucleotidyltranferase) n=1 Tax=Bacteroides stercorirosoris TaxID=871324 RepID=A0A1M6ERE4_9BACE|nr:hypothetical protein [Bacteroides stercorirosoris]OKZ14439.1 MAG: hypothetical protein BHV75_01060 [Bacteroides oleiciplenus]SHI87995.1 ppGpp synthetase catalytic domain-containing protein (RelA/SpoT-type nucleotidyltranferase) [Bacteroides stercorirosoris]
MKNNIIDEYKKEKPIYQRVAEKLQILINELLRENSIHIHQISCRIKEEDSLSNKISLKEDKYKRLTDITDIVGIRIITYLDSDVDLVADMIKKEFNVDTANSIDKRKLDNDVFGYRSLHFVASFSDERCKLTEFKVIKDKKFEIQIRSILQHAWAEIEHDLGYKSSISVPDDFIRGFNRLSALLETADIEFDRLKKSLYSYEHTLPKLIKERPNDIEINQASITSYAKNNPLNKEAIQKIVSIRQCRINYKAYTNELLFNSLSYLNIKTIGDLERTAISVKEKYIQFIEEVHINDADIISGTNITTPIFYLCYYIALSRDCLKELADVSNKTFSRKEIRLYNKAFNKINEITPSK